MESAVVLAGFVLVSIVVIYVVISSTTLMRAQNSIRFEKLAQEDLKNIYDYSWGMYRIGWTSSPKVIPLSNKYKIYVTKNSISLGYAGINISDSGPIPFVPVNLTASTINLTYVVYEGSGHINISES